jgi:hypothetical protein
VSTPGRDIKCGDLVTVTLDGGVRVLKVTGMAPRRGDAAAASLLYADLSRANNPGGGACEATTAGGRHLPVPRRVTDRLKRDVRPPAAWHTKG